MCQWASYYASMRSSSIVGLGTLLRLAWRLAKQQAILGGKLIKLNHATAHENVRYLLTARLRGEQRFMDVIEQAHLQISRRGYVKYVSKRVTAQVGDLVQDRRRDFAKDVGSQVRASMMAQPCFLAVEKNERMSAKSTAPSTERKPPEIFWRNFIMRPSRSA